jgi:hypothetical protein
MSTSRDDELAVASALLNFGGVSDSGGDAITASTSVASTSKNSNVATTTTTSTEETTVVGNNIHEEGYQTKIGDKRPSFTENLTTIPNHASSSAVSSGNDANTPSNSHNHHYHDPHSLLPANKRARTIETAVAAGAVTSSEKEGVFIIQDCHAVLGDRHCAGRTTVATVILREIKLKYKERYKGKGVDSWYDEAMNEYYTRLKERVTGYTDADYSTILVYSHKNRDTTATTSSRKESKKNKTTEEASSRIEKANCFMYHNDPFPKYGIAKLPEAVKFFFNSKDAPTLSKEIAKYRFDFERLKQSTGKLPPAGKLQFFEDFLVFCEGILVKAREDEMAQQLLTSLNLIPTFKRLWDTLKASVNYIGDGSSTGTSITYQAAYPHPASVAQAVIKATQPVVIVPAPPETSPPSPPKHPHHHHDAVTANSTVIFGTGG